MNERPRRIQRRRTRGWRKPEGAINCTRPSLYANPFLWEDEAGRTKPEQAAAAVAKYRAWVDAHPALRQEIIDNLRGHDLMCYCELSDPCHVDVLLEVAND